MQLPTLDGVDVSGKKIIVRTDFNVPMEGDKILDATRILEVLPTLRNLMERGAKVVMISHLGRPKGKVVPELSLRPIAAYLYEALNEIPVFFADETVGPSPQALIETLHEGEMALLENLRFYPGEEQNDENFAANLSQLADIYVNEAFSCAHRAHASTVGITNFLPAYAGDQFIKEVNSLETILDQPKRPFLAAIGGAKVSTKLNLLKNLTARVDRLFVGGAMANTFLLERGLSIGNSLCEKEMLADAHEIIELAEINNCELILPVDVVISNDPNDTHHIEIVDIHNIPDDKMVLDIGPKTIDMLKEYLETSKTLMWNGSMGVSEKPPFETGTVNFARAISNLTEKGQLVSVAGGGDTVADLNRAGCSHGITYVSLAGGAFLEWVEGRVLPGIEALKVSGNSFKAFSSPEHQ